MNDFREPTADERAVLERLLSIEFPGVEVLRKQLQDVLVRPADDDGCLDLQVCGDSRAEVAERVPTEGVFTDKDGVRGQLLVHVVGGKLSELEVIKEDNSALKWFPTVDEVQIADWLEQS